MSKQTLRNRIRSLKRLLSNKTLSEAVQQQKQGELQQLERQLEQRQGQAGDEQRVQKLTDKYKAVRFFERRKVQRKIDQLNKQLSKLLTRPNEVSEEEKALRNQLAKHQADLEYVKYFPVGVKYVSLFPGKGESVADAASVEAQRQALRETIRQNRARQAEARAKRQDGGAKEQQDAGDPAFFEDAVSDEDSQQREQPQRGKQRDAHARQPSGDEAHQETRRPLQPKRREGKGGVLEIRSERSSRRLRPGGEPPGIPAAVESSNPPAKPQRIQKPHSEHSQPQRQLHPEGEMREEKKMQHMDSIAADDFFDVGAGSDGFDLEADEVGTGDATRYDNHGTGQRAPHKLATGKRAALGVAAVRSKRPLIEPAGREQSPQAQLPKVVRKRDQSAMQQPLQAGRQAGVKKTRPVVPLAQDGSGSGSNGDSSIDDAPVKPASGKATDSDEEAREAVRNNAALSRKVWLEQFMDSHSSSDSEGSG